MALFLTLLAVALSQSPAGVTKAEAANNTCPAGTDLREPPEDCPDLENRQILSPPEMPETVYRGDSRMPYDIFRLGFTSRGSNSDVVAHVQGDRAGNSNYISTTGTLSVAEPFARSQGLRNLESAAARGCAAIRTGQYAQQRNWFARAFLPVTCNGRTHMVTADTYVYDIDPRLARHAIHIPTQIHGNANLYNHYRTQNEWAVVHRIPSYAIRGVRVYRMTARANGYLIETRTITMATRSTFMRNDRYGVIPITYDPARDPAAHFNFNTDLNTPPLPRNPYTRGCSAATQCRGGGS